MPQPLRTCVGCRACVPAGELVRLVVVDDRVTVDAGRRLPGRGAHLHPRRSCLDLALRRRAVGRALRRPELDASPLADDPVFAGELTAS